MCPGRTRRRRDGALGDERPPQARHPRHRARSGAPVVVRAGMMGDRVSIVFASLQDLNPLLDTASFSALPPPLTDLPTDPPHPSPVPPSPPPPPSANPSFM